MQGITKRFGAVTALDQVDLHVEPQTIHAIVGENGAGKTTLMRALYGASPADLGQIDLHGRHVSFTSAKQAIEAGIGMVSQHYAIIPELTCLQNLILGAEGGLIIDSRSAEARAEELAQRMGFSFQWQRPAAELSPGGAQKLEILKLLWRNAQIMILDEPTAMLSPSDGDALFASLHKLASEGATIILVTHRLPEVLDHCRTVTVLRGGRLVAEKPVSDTSSGELARLIVGAQLSGPEAVASRQPGEKILDVANLVVKGDRGNEAVRGIHLTVRAGEVLGIAGVDGNGQRELFQAISGTRPSLSGTIAIAGHEGGSTSQRLGNGLRIIPEDRHEEGVIETWSLEENAALGLQRFAPLAKGALVDVTARRKWAEAVAARFNTKHGGLSQPMASLSGGNQQRFVAARALGFQPKLLLAFQPARGLDIGGTLDLYREIRRTCNDGAAAVVVSFDLDELLDHCDRIAVMHDGQLLQPAPGQERDRDAIGRLMVGAT
jgi:simple sugar transport system ATP-binding protein